MFKVFDWFSWGGWTRLLLQAGMVRCTFAFQRFIKKMWASGRSGMRAAIASTLVADDAVAR